MDQIEWKDVKPLAAPPRLDSGAGDDLHWFALRVAPQKEYHAKLILESRGVECFVPTQQLYRRLNRYVRPKVLRNFPVLPGYVFAGFHAPSPPWLHIFAIRPIKGVVGRDGKPWCLNSGVFTGKIAADNPTVKFATFLSSHADGDLMVKAPPEQRHMRTHREFAVGDMVQIMEGPFDGQFVQVSEITGKSAKVLMMLFGQQHDVAVRLECLEVVG